MTMWLCRAGRYGEYENKFLEDNAIYCTWDNLNEPLYTFPTKQDLQNHFVSLNNDVKVKTAMNWASQVWPFGHEMKIGEIVVLPSKISSTIHFGHISGDYEFCANADNPYYHKRTVEWFATNVPRDLFDQDILYSLGAFMTICRIKQESRINTTLAAYIGGISQPLKANASDDVDFSEALDLENAAIESIKDLIIQKFKGHGMTKLVESILKAKGYATISSLGGPDNGVDILASQGSLGFGEPRICVQVKSSDGPIDRTVLDQLIGVMRNFKAQYGLLVSWGGFKSSIIKERMSHFFEIRLWDHKDVINELLEHYDNLDQDIKDAIPLRKIWVINNWD